MDLIWGGSMGTVLSCIPGKLAFFRGEEKKSELLLQHPLTPKELVGGTADRFRYADLQD
jgi:hypothetical protein